MRAASGGSQESSLTLQSERARSSCLAAQQTQVELAAREADAGHRQEILNQLECAARRTGRLANQLLALARAEPAGAVTGAGEPIVSLAGLAGELAPGWVQRAAAARIDLGFELEPAEVGGIGLCSAS
ncbi:MAG TPA: hypothetical protein VLW45_03945 [Pelomicrobium sp.]|nr:hypothetical protein [Pelomicrobium sp.]